MPTNEDSFPITAAMLAYSWVKPAVSFTTVAGKATTTDVYLPATLAERAGARGGSSQATPSESTFGGQALTVNANWSFAIAAEGPAVECDATLTVTNVESLMVEDEAVRSKAEKADEGTVRSKAKPGEEKTEDEDTRSKAKK